MKYSIMDFKKRIVTKSDITCSEILTETLNKSSSEVLTNEIDINIESEKKVSEHEVVNEDINDDTKRKYSKSQEMITMRKLYTEVNDELYPFAMEVIDEYEYEGSPLYDEDGVPREVISQMTDKVLTNAKYSVEEIEELELSENDNIMDTTWSSWLILRSSTESILLNDIFNIRRAKYFDYY